VTSYYTDRDSQNIAFLAWLNTMVKALDPAAYIVAEGPWATIVAEAENQGAFTWRPERGVPPRVYLRVEVADAAGNVGSATSEEAVAVAQSRFTGRLGDLKPLPASTAP